jgi:hypothetical protein
MQSRISSTTSSLGLAFGWLESQSLLFGDKLKHGRHLAISYHNIEYNNNWNLMTKPYANDTKAVFGVDTGSTGKNFSWTICWLPVFLGKVIAPK